MGKHQPLAEHLTTAELLERYRQATDPAARQRWHALWLVSDGRTRSEVAGLLGVARSTVIRWAQQYDRLGPDGVGDGRRHLPGRAPLVSHLSADQVAALRALVEGGQAPTSVGGGLWTGLKVARWYALARGQDPATVHDKTGWRLLQQLGCSLQRPRPRHPQASDEAQEAFRKGALPRP